MAMLAELLLPYLAPFDGSLVPACALALGHALALGVLALVLVRTLRAFDYEHAAFVVREASVLASSLARISVLATLLVSVAMHARDTYAPPTNHAG